MGMLSAIGRFLKSWIVVVPLLAVLGLAAGYGTFFHVLPGKPQIGVIDIPFTGIDENSAAIITSYLAYARLNPRIKGVVIKLASPGGGASASAQLYQETARLREEKPVVMVMNGMVASGGYMMAMGVNHTYAKGSTLVGNVGVVAGTGPIFPPQIPEQFAFSGPYKLTGADRRDWISDLDMLKQAFVQMVVKERGDRLKISAEELGNGKLYTGLEAVSLGLVDEIGSDALAFRKVAELAGISNYGLVNVNVEVNRLFVQELRRIYSSSGDVNDPLSPSDVTLMRILSGPGPLTVPPSVPGEGEETGDMVPEIGDPLAGPGLPDRYGPLLRPMEQGHLGIATANQFPDVPFEINRPQFYYLYVGVDQ